MQWIQVQFRSFFSIADTDKRCTEKAEKQIGTGSITFSPFLGL